MRSWRWTSLRATTGAPSRIHSRLSDVAMAIARGRRGAPPVFADAGGRWTPHPLPRTCTARAAAVALCLQARLVLGGVASRRAKGRGGRGARGGGLPDARLRARIPCAARPSRPSTVPARSAPAHHGGRWPAGRGCATPIYERVPPPPPDAAQSRGTKGGVRRGREGAGRREGLADPPLRRRSSPSLSRPLPLFTAPKPPILPMTDDARRAGQIASRASAHPRYGRAAALARTAPARCGCAPRGCHATRPERGVS